MMQFFKNEYEAFRLEQIKYFFPFVLLYVVYSFLIGLLFVNVNYICFGSEYYGSSLYKSLSFTIGFLISFPIDIHKVYRDFSYNDFLVALDMTFSKAKTSPFLNSYSDSEEIRWKNDIYNFIVQFRRGYHKRFKKLFVNLGLAIACFIVTSYVNPALINKVSYSYDRFLNTLFRGFSLEVVDGMANEKDDGVISLSEGSGRELTILDNNLIKISARGTWDKIPTIIFETEGLNKNKQFFQMMPVFSSSNANEITGYELGFSAESTGKLYIPVLGDSAVMRVVVKRLPIPEVNLQAITNIKEVISDDDPLELEIKAIAKNPLSKIKLKIDVDGKSYEELVSDIMVAEKFDYSNEYSLVLENYMQSDIAKVHISAVAIDKNIPNALIGESNVISLTAASAYGRYQQALGSLREIKASLDDAISGNKEALQQDLSTSMKKSIEMSRKSPFFDGLDRFDLSRIQNNIDELKSKFSTDKLLEASDNLNNFLFEHESIDDRERDRDFFVAVRSLSRLIETDRNSRSMTVMSFNKRLTGFLKTRQKRWALRIKYLSDPSKLKFLSRSKNDFFIKALTKVTKQAEMPDKKSSSEALKNLTVMTAHYREFIEDLEKVEDSDRQQKEQKRQEGIANARDKLRELQKRQGKISSTLDRADRRDKSEIAAKWPSSRMDQNANLKNTKSLEAEMRSLSPRASERIKAAWKSMEIVIEAAAEDNFIKAESASDIAGRLLRKADSAARQDQKKKRQRGRRKRSESNKYYGNQIVGGDVEISREYNVDRRYREDIIEEVQRNQDSDLDKDDQKLLDNYLRQVIR